MDVSTFPSPLPSSSGGSEKASLIPSGDHSQPETKQITALTVLLEARPFEFKQPKVFRMPQSKTVKFQQGT